MPSTPTSPGATGNSTKSKSKSATERMVCIKAPMGLPTDDHSLKELATTIQGMMHSTPGACSTEDVLVGESASQFASAALDAEAQQLAQEKWLAGLTTTKAGQTLMDHLTHAEAAPHMKTSSAYEQAAAFRRVFIHALRFNTAPFGLPKCKLPKYMAIVNLSGERLFMYSENACLVAFLTMGADGMHPASAGVQKILDHAVSTPHCSVLLCYSLPFQAGFDAAYWECRTVVRTSSGSVDDSYLVCSNWDRQASKGTPTLHAEAQDETILQSQAAAFADNMMACDLDVSIEPIDGIDPSQCFDEKNGKLMKMVTMLQNERKKIIAEHKQEMDELKAIHELDVLKTTELVGASFKKQGVETDQMHERTEQAETEVRMLRVGLKKVENELQQHKSDSMLREEELKGNNADAHAKSCELQSQIDKLNLQLKTKDRDREHALAKQAQAHRSMHEATERKLQSAKGEIGKAKQSITESDVRSKKVELAFESVCGEKTLLVSQLADSRKEHKSIKMRLSIACGRAEKLNEMMQSARMAHVKAEEQLSAVTKQLSEHTATSATIQEAAGAAAHESEELEKERNQLAIRVGELEEECKKATMAKSVATMKDSETMTVPIMSKAELELGELQTAHVKLQDEIAEKKTEIDQLKIEVARTRARSGKRPPPPSFLPDGQESKSESAIVPTAGSTAVVGVPTDSSAGGGGRSPPHPPQTQVNIMVPTGNGATGPTVDIGHDPAGDPMLESTLQQLQMVMRTVADIARSGKGHERAARDAYAKLEAYERMGGSSFPPYYAQQQQQSGWYGPPAVQGHMNGHGVGYQ